jgi:A/G-specific adenine glycosylase
MLVFMHKKRDAITVFCTEMWKWFDRHKRVLPWRDLQVDNVNHRAYMVLVSEMMLQQTQVPRVMVLYPLFLAQFPTMQHLARATNADVIRAWKGLGYNNRAIRLRDAVRSLVDEQHGTMPESMDELMALKGIGAYTAAAVRNFAFFLPTPCLDTNIRRILHRFFHGPENDDGTWSVSDRELLPLAEEVLEHAMDVRRASSCDCSRVSADWHAALMDFGSLVCTKKKPAWDLMSPALRSVCSSDGWQNPLIKRSSSKAEPGRMMAGVFVPRRIIRGRIIAALRDHPQGLSTRELGTHITVDREVSADCNWIEDILLQLQRDHLIEQRGTRWILSGA